MARKRQDYFAAGVQIVWQVDPTTRTVEVFTAPAQSTVLHAVQALEGGTVFPGFTFPLAALFGTLDHRGES
jgi:Uma2 family endonuclease